ncbi:reverse transcriptase domain-containing protein [Tanacetum coccineum]
MSICLANHSYQYPMGIAENMLVQVGKFVFPADFVILQMEEDDKFPLILGRPFLHTADAIIRVKNKELNLGVGDDRITFLIDKSTRHSYSNDDTYFRVDVIDEVTKEEFDALLDEFEPFSTTSEKISESSLDYEFKEFMAIKIKEIPEQEEEVGDNFKELPLKENLRIKNSIQDSSNDLVIKPLPKHLEYVFLEKESLLPVVISTLLKTMKRSVFYFQIPIEPADQEKTTFTCPYETYAYKRMPFGLCNAPTTFQRCMIAIFQDMLETSIEVFMDDFLVFRDSFDSCLANLEQMLIRCKQAHLVLNWEKCHFMVTEGIVLGHKVSSAGLEVDKVKIDLITKLPPPTNIKVVRSFLGHARFHRRFIKDFSKISRPMTKLLEKM